MVFMIRDGVKYHGLWVVPRPSEEHLAAHPNVGNADVMLLLYVPENGEIVLQWRFRYYDHPERKGGGRVHWYRRGFPPDVFGAEGSLKVAKEAAEGVVILCAARNDREPSYIPLDGLDSDAVADVLHNCPFLNRRDPLRASPQLKESAVALFKDLKMKEGFCIPNDIRTGEKK